MLVPLLAPSDSGAAGLSKIAKALGVAAIKAVVAIVSIIAGGRVLLRPLYRRIAAMENAEIFAATTLLVVLGTSVFTQIAGLSLALGAFLVSFCCAVLCYAVLSSFVQCSAVHSFSAKLQCCDVIVAKGEDRCYHGHCSAALQLCWAASSCAALYPYITTQLMTSLYGAYFCWYLMFDVKYHHNVSSNGHPTQVLTHFHAILCQDMPPARTRSACASQGSFSSVGLLQAGLLVAETEFALQVESDIAPYKGLLMGLFFMTVGMEISVGLFFAEWRTVVGGIILLIGGKVGPHLTSAQQCRMT